MAAEAPASSSTGTYLPVLDALRILAALGVVGIHTVAGAISAGRGGVAAAGLDMALIAAVPLFFAMAGALNLDARTQRHGARSFLRRRLGRIIPALLIWSLFYIAVIRVGVSGQEIGRTSWEDMLVTGLTYTHLYFLWAIAGLYLLTPLIIGALAPDERVRSWVVGIGLCVWTALVMAVPALTEGRHVPLELGSLTFALAYAGYFVLGRAALAAPLSRRAGALALVVAGAMIPVLTWLFVLDHRTGEEGGGPLLDTLAPSYVSPAVMLYSVCLFAGIIALGRTWRVSARTERVLRTLGETTFGIYLIHMAVLVVLRTTPAFAEPSPGRVLALWAIAVGVSAVLTLVMRRVPGLRRLV